MVCYRVEFFGAVSFRSCSMRLRFRKNVFASPSARPEKRSRKVFRRLEIGRRETGRKRICRKAPVDRGSPHPENPFARRVSNAMPLGCKLNAREGLQPMSGNTDVQISAADVELRRQRHDAEIFAHVHCKVFLRTVLRSKVLTPNTRTGKKKRRCSRTGHYVPMSVPEPSFFEVWCASHAEKKRTKSG